MPWPTKARTTPKPWLSTCCWTACETSPSRLPGPALRDAVLQALPGHVEQLLHPRRHRPHRQRERAVGVVPLHDTPQVQPDDVALLAAGAARDGNAVHDLLVDRDAHGGREAPVSLEGRARAPRDRMKRLHVLVDLQGRDARA